MIPAEAFTSASLRQHPQGEAITRILAASIEAAHPGEAVRRALLRKGDSLTVAGRDYDLKAYRRICLLAFGKAAGAMSAAAVDALGRDLPAGLLVSKQPVEGLSLPPAVERLTGDHPVPGEGSLRAGEKALTLVSSLGADDLLVCLISGGGSALLSAPPEGLSLVELGALTTHLLRCGARIDEINTLRRRLDRLKGGGLARLSNGATLISLILSDVVGNPLEAIASGPSAPDPSTRADALAVWDKYDLGAHLPASILACLQSAAETPKPGDPLFDRVQNVIVGSNLLSAQAALRQAEQEGFTPYLLRADLQGEARQAAFELATLLRQTCRTGEPVAPPACLVCGGETTVTLSGGGRGGRNTELALAAVTELADFPGVVLITLATDGEDGSTAAAGAVVSGETHRRARELGLNPGACLRRNDSFPFFEALDDLLKPGATGTNVNDLVLMFAF